MRLLLVEDSERLQRSIREGFESEGFAMDVVGDGKSGLALVETYDYDVVILDLNLPQMDGLTVLTQLRACGKDNHVLILSARDQVEDRIRGLEAGADDYLVKPFVFEELVARVKALSRRKYQRKATIIQLGPLQVNIASQQVFLKEKAINLTPKEFALLELLLLNRGQVVSRSRLMDHLNDGESIVESNVVDVMICNLRRKIRSEGQPDLIQTRRGNGYLIS